MDWFAGRKGIAVVDTDSVVDWWVENVENMGLIAEEVFLDMKVHHIGWADMDWIGWAVLAHMDCAVVARSCYPFVEDLCECL
ncbi:hypothetical protein [Bifidobacterium cebidarum]|uniref:hypothetical protein n=1 Tax=Bifidobacterium cebidarum TaxID=2650773 RepID=UPI0012659CD3|nr:hypothetical protein [Bifidobacterium cebidarum]